MELSKCKKFLNDSNYVHCTICANFRNSNSFAHRKSDDHQKRLAIKLRKITFHLSQKKKKTAVIHDEQWTERDCKRFCHFCGCNYLEHHNEDEFIIENLGSLYHHSNSQHIESVKLFLKRNFRKEEPEKFCIKKKDLDSFLEKLPEIKKRYLKKMDILNDMVVNQIKASEEERKKLVIDEVQAQASCSYELQHPTHLTEIKRNETKSQPMLNSLKNMDVSKRPPWLEDVSTDSTCAKRSTAPIIGPTMDTLIKHVANQKKKGLSKNRIGANFKHQIQKSSRWLPSFHGVWNQRRQRQLKSNWNQKNKNSGV